MKILYVFDSQDHEVFKMSDLPESFEILRKDKKPIVFKPAAIQMQDLQGRLDRAERLLKQIHKETRLTAFDEDKPEIRRSVDEYFDRYEQ